MGRKRATLRKFTAQVCANLLITEGQLTDAQTALIGREFSKGNLAQFNVAEKIEAEKEQVEK